MSRIVLIVVLVVAYASPLAADNWERYRGPNGSGNAIGPAPPTKWSSEKNVKWTTPLPGKGTSSPIVSGERVFLTCYAGYGLIPEDPGEPLDLVRHLLAFDRKTGKEIWRASVPSGGNEDPYQGFITQHGYASSSPTTDGERVFALLGKSGLYAFDLSGNELWKFDVGQKSDPAKWGDGSSPIVVGDLVIVDAGVLGNQFVAIDKVSGQKAWSLEDPTFTNCWATPVLANMAASSEVLFHIPKRIMGLDLRTGKTLWTAESPIDDAACGSIVVNDGRAYLMGSRTGNAMAIRCGGSGDVSASHTLWKTRLRAGITTPVILGENLYWTTGGIFYAANAETGEYVYKQRLPRLGGPTGGFPNADYSSPIIAGEHIIQFTRNGESYVIKPGNEFELVSHNPAFRDDDSAFSATPAVSEGELFIRSENNLYCISASQR